MDVITDANSTTDYFNSQVNKNNLMILVIMASIVVTSVEKLGQGAVENQNIF